MSRSVFLSSTTQLTCHLELYFSIRLKPFQYWRVDAHAHANNSKNPIEFPLNVHLKWHWCWWQRYNGDYMAVTDSRFRWQNHYVGDFCVTLLYLKIRIYNRRWISQCIDLTKMSRKIPVRKRLIRYFQTCHQRIWSPTSFANIIVTELSLKTFRWFRSVLFKWFCLMIESSS